ncbi:MAG: DUF881 domain-containing protein [Bacillota bacterium]|nr:DUF881 domain-containing protein [Bacillota bacterium]
MSGYSDHRSSSSGKVQLVILVIILINTILIAFGYYYVITSVRAADNLFSYKQELARDLSDYIHRLANDMEVDNVPAVREALAEYNYAVDLAVTSDDLIQIILNQGRCAQETIIREADDLLKEKVMAAVNEDAIVQGTAEKTHLYIRVTEGKIDIYPDQFLEPHTVQEIKTIYTQDRCFAEQSIDLEIVDGTATLVVPQTTQEQLETLNEDRNSLRLRLYEMRVQAGLAEMVGPGITLQIYDAMESEGSRALVHDADIRDIVNELFSAGARGVSVGGQRLTVTSAIRCTGPLIMVNYQQIPTNPVTIQAVGEPDLLISGLDIIIEELEDKRGLVFNISHSGFIKLPAYVYAE